MMVRVVIGWFVAMCTAMAEAPPTYAREVAPLLREKCVACHQADGLAPFSLATYAEARERAGKISRIVLDALMPPWLPTHRGFADARRLTAREGALLRQWVEAGAPEGEAIEPDVGSPQAWRLGKPDMVLTVPAPHVVPAGGRIQTVHFVFPLALKEERYLRAVEVIPGNPRVVLQANALFDRSGRARELAGEAGWYERFGSSGFFPFGRVAAYFPGEAPRALGEGIALRLPTDSDFVLQVRYRPTTEPEMDFSRVALYFAEEPPAKTPSGVLLGNEDLRVPPGELEHTIRDKVTLAAPLEVHEVRPNLLLFGTAVKAWAEPPRGAPIPLLHIDDWDFTWQETYRFAEPIALPKGTRIVAEWTIHNHTDREIRAGDTPDDEAPGLWVGGVVAEWADHVTHTGANLQHYTDLVNAARRRK